MNDGVPAPESADPLGDADEMAIFTVQLLPPDIEEPSEALKQRVDQQMSEYFGLYQSLGGARFGYPSEQSTSSDEPKDLRFVFVCNRGDADRICAIEGPEYPYNGDEAAVAAWILEIEQFTARVLVTVPSPWKIDGGEEDVWVKVKRYDAKPIFDQFTDFDPKLSNRCFGGQSTPDLLPLAGEAMDEWMQRVALSTDDVDKILRFWKAANENERLFSASYPGRKLARPEFLVGGLFPRGMVTTFVGAGGVGKSTLATALAASIVQTGSPDQKFLGGTVHGGGNVAVFTNEEDEATWHSRLRKFGDELVVYCFKGVTSPEECLKLVSLIPDVSLVIFDPLVSFVGEDEDNSVKTSNAFVHFNKIASLYNCAVLCLHHFKKGLPRNIALSDTARYIRGSSAIWDRSRLIMVMLDRSQGTVDIGIVKSNLMPEDMTWAKVNESRRFYRNEDTLTLDAVPASGGNKVSMPCNGEPGALGKMVLKVISGMSEVRRTGNKSVYANKGASLADVSRAKIESIVESLVGRGRLVEADGIISLAG